MEKINNWDDWGKIFQSIPAFTPLIKHIMAKENLPFFKIENLKPGTNAVFKVGLYVVKIFAPLEFSKDEDYGTNVDVELFGIKLANNQGVPSPKLFSYGAVADKYYFRYMIMEYICGKLLGEIEEELSFDEKMFIGKQVRSITDKLNVPCENFTNINVMEYAIKNNGWKDERFPESLQAERLANLADFYINEQDKVYCHSDFHCGNILVDENLNVYLIDFADAMFAPVEYEKAYITSALFCFEKPYMTGYFGDYTVDDITDLCMAWLPVHAWGHATIVGNFESVEDISSFSILRERLKNLIETEKNKEPTIQLCIENGGYVNV
jgi:serine/threonine protein kinase